MLDRSLYTAVNKVLVACGGRWVRSEEAHIFPADAKFIVDAVLNTGEVRTAREQGWFPTPPELAARVVAEAGIERGHKVLEPSAGEGALVLAVRNACPEASIQWVELDLDRSVTLSKIAGPGICGDFLGIRPRAMFDRVVMNPPFSASSDAEHILHAFRMLAPGGRLVAIASAGVGFRSGRSYEELRSLIEKSGKAENLPEKSFASSGTNVRTVLITLNAAQ